MAMAGMSCVYFLLLKRGWWWQWQVFLYRSFQLLGLGNGIPKGSKCRSHLNKDIDYTDD